MRTMRAGNAAHHTHKPPLKWVSAKGTLLGTCTLPARDAPHVYGDLDRHGHVSFVVRVAFDVIATLPRPPFDAVGPSPYRQVSIRESHHLRDGYVILGITPEEWEMLPEFTFAPSAGYIRSLLAAADQ